MSSRPYNLRRLPSSAARRLGSAAAGALLLATLPSLAAAREPASPAEPDLVFHDEASVAWVLVPVVVRDASGFVEGLPAERFRLWVDERPVAVESFERDVEAAVSLIYLQDLSGSMANGGKLEASREAFTFFVEAMGPGDELALATFASGRTHVEVPFTTEPQPLVEALGLWRAWGTTALHDAVAWLPDIHAEGRNLKRAALLVTDGADNASSLEPEAARSMVRRARLPVFVIGLETPSRPAASGAADGETFAHLLERLADATGGGYHAVASPAALKEACHAISEELRHQYVLGFRTRGTGPRSDHRLRVEVLGGDGYSINHRRGYRGDPPPAVSPTP